VCICNPLILARLIEHEIIKPNHEKTNGKNVPNLAIAPLVWSQYHDMPLNRSPLSEPIQSETEEESRSVVPTYLNNNPSAHKAPKTVPRADHKYPGWLSNVPP
jgi:hypothetical protein